MTKVIPYSLVPHRSRNRLTLRVRPDGAVIVAAGRAVPASAVREFVEGNADWIGKTRRRFAAHAVEHPPVGWIGGEALPILGETLRLEVRREPGRSRPRTRRRDGVLEVAVGPSAGTEIIRRAVRKFCAVELLESVAPAAGRHASALGVEPRRVRVGDFSSQWGSATGRGVVTLNWRLALAPPDLAEYVVVHELCHLRVRGHGAAFWRLVVATLPDAQARRRALRRASFALMRY
ncbi:MAG: SprT family zinc-dependent metalloprotease [Candidatus Coatesbacteria bacterium]